MAIDADGKLVRAVADTCTNYLPTSVATEVRSQKLGTIYKCGSYEATNSMFKDSAMACLFCKHMVMPQETYSTK